MEIWRLRPVFSNVSPYVAPKHNLRHLEYKSNFKKGIQDLELPHISNRNHEQKKKKRIQDQTKYLDI